MKLTRGAIVLYVGLVFASGVVLGAFGHNLYTVSTVRAARPEDYRKKTMEEMRRRLELSEEQATKLNGIMDETRARFHEAREKMKPEMDSIGHAQTEKIRAMLNPKQQAEYDKMRKEREERQRATGRPGPGI